MEIRQVGAELFLVDGRTDGQTDMTKLTFAFHSFAKAPKKHLARKGAKLYLIVPKVTSYFRRPVFESWPGYRPS